MNDEQLIQYLREQLASYFHAFDGTRNLGRGTAFPASADVPGGLQADDRFTRTDLDIECFYDGSQWLTMNEYFAPITDYVFTVAAGAAYGGGVPQAFARTLTRSDYKLYITRVIYFVTCSVPQTGVNNWRIALQSNFAGTTNLLYNTNGQSAGALTVVETAAASITQNPGTSSETRVLVDVKNGAPGTIVVEAAMYYRLVVT